MTLRVNIDDRDPHLRILCEGAPQIYRGRGLADATLLRGDRKHCGLTGSGDRMESV